MGHGESGETVLGSLVGGEFVVNLESDPKKIWRSGQILPQIQLMFVYGAFGVIFAHEIKCEIYI